MIGKYCLFDDENKSFKTCSKKHFKEETVQEERDTKKKLPIWQWDCELDDGLGTLWRMIPNQNM